MQNSCWAGALLLTCCLSVSAAAQNKQRPQGKQRPNQSQGQDRRGGRWPDQVKQGDAAVDFTLKTLDGKKSYTLSDFKGKQPVAMIFGSYT